VASRLKQGAARVDGCPILSDTVPILNYRALPRPVLEPAHSGPAPALSHATVRFSHIIATRDRPALLRTALETLVAAIPAEGEIIVVDGDPARSGEAVVRPLESQDGAAPIRYIAGISGLCSQRNAGIDAARGDVVIFTDDDCAPAPGFYEALASAYEDPQMIGATGRVLQRRAERIGSDIESRLRRIVLGGGRQGSMTSFGFRRPIVDVEAPCSVEYMPGTFMSGRRSVAAEVRFDEQLERLSGYALGEDDDFSYRLSRRGLIRYVPSAAVHHRSIGRDTADRRLLDRLVVTNRTYLFRKNFSQTFRGRLGFAALLVLLFGHRIINREWQGVRGLLDGLSDARQDRRTRDARKPVDRGGRLPT
jgi:glycosyltransferase involved in cell wall biosynthesis